MDLQESRAAAKRVLEELQGRKGFDWWWHDIEPRVKAEIRQAIAAAIRGEQPNIS